jgi:uncharacterized PurR-regulated membrane protein YhhQ (DUF165 family)
MTTGRLNSSSSSASSMKSLRRSTARRRFAGRASSGQATSSSASDSQSVKSPRTERTGQSWKLDLVLVALYLGAIVIANVAVATWGARALPFTAFLLIPFDLCARDVLHERWAARSLVLRMGGLVAAGSVLTMALSPGSGRVALASVAAFGTAAIVDTGVYQLAHGLKRFWKMNLSNLCSSMVDSILFPVIAFGSTTLALSATQSAAKFFGGVLWSSLFVVVVVRRRNSSEQERWCGLFRALATLLYVFGSDRQLVCWSCKGWHL